MSVQNNNQHLLIVFAIVGFGSNNNTISTLSMDSGAIKANSTEGSVLSNSTVLPVRIRVTKRKCYIIN